MAHKDSLERATIAILFGKNVAKRRKLLGWSQELFADKLGIGTDSLSRIEKGVYFPRANRLEAISACLKCHISELFFDEETPSISRYSVLEMTIQEFPADIREGIFENLASLVHLLHKYEGHTS